VRVATLLPEAWSLRHNLTVADALYVVLARHLDAVLVTADRRLASSPDSESRSSLRNHRGPQRTGDAYRALLTGGRDGLLQRLYGSRALHAA
jgi:hypothetical protein